MRLTFFTDGSCHGNGTRRARATYGVVQLVPASEGTSNLVEARRGKVAPFEYRLIGGELQATTTPLQPSNNRGEYLAAIHALLLAIEGGATECHLVSDSNILVQTFLDWLPKRKAKGTANQLKNYDLVQIIDALTQQIEVKWEHVRGHQKAVSRAAYADPAMYSWAMTCKAGNDAADAAANAAHDDPDTPPEKLTPHQRLARLEARQTALAERLAHLEAV